MEPQCSAYGSLARTKSVWFIALRKKRYVARIERLSLNNNSRAALYKFLDDDGCPNFESGD